MGHSKTIFGNKLKLKKYFFRPGEFRGLMYLAVSQTNNHEHKTDKLQLLPINIPMTFFLAANAVRGFFCFKDRMFFDVCLEMDQINCPSFSFQVCF